MKFIDLHGKTFARLTVLSRDVEKESHNTHWICRCSCGTIHSIASSSLTSGAVRSCGCLRRESNAKRKAVRPPGWKRNRAPVPKGGHYDKTRHTVVLPRWRAAEIKIELRPRTAIDNSWLRFVSGLLVTSTPNIKGLPSRVHKIKDDDG